MKRYSLIAVDSIPTPKISSIGFSDDTKVTRFGPSVRNQYIIHYVVSGKGYFNGSLVEKGQGFLITPGLHEEYHSNPKEPWSFVWIISEDSAMEYFFTRYGANKTTGIFNFSNFYELNLLIEKLRSSSNSFSTSAELSELFLRVFNSCFDSRSKSQISPTKLYFEFSVNYIKTNISLPITVNELCNIIGITQPYLYRIFKQFVGCSPKQYVTKYKLKESKRLLTQTDLSVSQIAHSLGFQSVLDFSKFFLKQTKSSPTTYRKTNH